MALPSQVARAPSVRLSQRGPAKRNPRLQRIVIGAVILTVLGGGSAALITQRGDSSPKPLPGSTAPITRDRSAGPSSLSVGKPTDAAPKREATPVKVMGETPGRAGPTLAASSLNTLAGAGSSSAAATRTPAEPSAMLAPKPAAEPPSPPPAPPAATANPPASTPSGPATLVTPGRDAAVAALIEQGDRAMAANRPIEARDAYNRALHSASVSGEDQQMLRARLGDIADKVTFSSTVVPDDTMASAYSIQGGDSLAKVARNEDLKLDWRFISRINQITDPRRLKVGQRVKLIRGPFHAVVDKTDFRLDLYADTRDSAGNRLLIKSFAVGLGEYGSTPLGNWVVRPSSKLINPAWVNPRTGEQFAADDPKNPIGERWIGLDGVDPGNRDKQGYGIHGTIEPESIGQERSMGCVRMLQPDVELMYELMVENGSTVEIRP